MKIEESFRDLKSLLGMSRLMNKKQVHMEKMVAMLLVVYAIGLLLGERLRDRLYGGLMDEQESVPEEMRNPGSPLRKRGKKWRRYSGLFVLLKQKWELSFAEWRTISNDALAEFIAIVRLVLTYV